MIPRRPARLVRCLVMSAFGLAVSCASVDESALGSTTATTSATSGTFGATTTTSTAPASTTKTTPPPEAPAASGCGAPVTAELPRSITLADGTVRTFRLTLPAGYDAAVAHPLVFDFHGLGSNGFQQALVSTSEAVGRQAGYLVVVPDGADGPIGRSWGLTADNADVVFVDELLARIEADLCIDPARIYAMGLSNGGFFASRLACDRSERFAAVASVAGIAHPDDCDPERAVPVLHFHGTADEIVPFEGGDSSLLDRFDAQGELLAELFVPVEGEVDDWAFESGCEPEPAIEAVSAEVERRRFVGCDEGGAVEMYVVDGGGHTWPGSLTTAFIASLGPTTLDIDATQLAFDWFAAHPMPAAGS